MERVKEESQENHLLFRCKLLPVKWNILMMERKLILLGNGQEYCQLIKKSEWEAELRNEIYQIPHLWVSLHPKQVSRKPTS